MILAVCLAIASTFTSVANVQRENSPLPPNLLPGPAKMPSGLFVGTCYQPIDRSPEQIVQDIAIMRDAGFNVVRMPQASAWCRTRTLYINTNDVDVTVPIAGTKKGLISNKIFQDKLVLPQRGAELVE